MSEEESKSTSPMKQIFSQVIANGDDDIAWISNDTLMFSLGSLIDLESLFSCGSKWIVPVEGHSFEHIHLCSWMIVLHIFIVNILSNIHDWNRFQ